MTGLAQVGSELVIDSLSLTFLARVWGGQNQNQNQKSELKAD